MLKKILLRQRRKSNSKKRKKEYVGDNMNKKIIYLKEVTSYDDILKTSHNKMPLFIKRKMVLMN